MELFTLRLPNANEGSLTGEPPPPTSFLLTGDAGSRARGN
jgi:hypothetical protein